MIVVRRIQDTENLRHHQRTARVALHGERRVMQHQGLVASSQGTWQWKPDDMKISSLIRGLWVAFTNKHQLSALGACAQTTHLWQGRAYSRSFRNSMPSAPSGVPAPSLRDPS